LRATVLEFAHFFFVSVHFPQAGENVREFGRKVADLVTTLPIPAIVGGDIAVAHDDIDVYDPAEQPGLTPDEREWFQNFLSTGLIDTYRSRHSDLQTFN
jgi:exodeoxyribonuclease-3